MLSVRQAAVYLGLSIWTVRAMVGAGTLRRVPLPGVRRLLIDRLELEGLVEIAIAG